MFADIILTANHYFIDAFAGIIVMLIGPGHRRWAGGTSSMRIVSPDSKIAREKGWVPWMYWLCGVPDTVLHGRRSTAQTA